MLFVRHETRARCVWTIEKRSERTHFAVPRENVQKLKFGQRQATGIKKTLESYTLRIPNYYIKYNILHSCTEMFFLNVFNS